MRRILAILPIIISTTGCIDKPWNNPNPTAKAGEIVYYSSFSLRPKHLDPARSYSTDEGLFVDQIYEPPLQYHYLKRPYELIPLTLESMPRETYLDANREVLPSTAAANSIAYTRYTLTLKKGIQYQPHPAFAKNEDGQYLYHFDSEHEGQQYTTLYDFEETGTKQLTARDYVYQIKRMADPKNLSPIKSLLETYIVEFSDLNKQIKVSRENLKDKDSWIDLEDFNIAGLNIVNDYTYEITINGLYPQFKYWLAMRFFSPLPKEADRFYHNPGFKKKNISLDWYPVGTAAFMLTKNDPNSEMVLERNPNFHEERFPSVSESIKFYRFSEKKLPFIDKAIFRLEKEALPLFTKFSQGYYDRSGETHANIGSHSFDQVFSFGADGIELTPDMQEKNIQLEQDEKPAIYYTGFNMLDPVVGGYDEKSRKLRQAISIAYNDQEYVDIFANGQGKEAHSPIPPGIPGYQEGVKGYNPIVFDWEQDRPIRKSIDYAKELLAEAGYPNGRDEKTGKPLVLYIDMSASSSSSTPILDWKRKQFEKIGIQLEFRITDYNRFKEKVRQGNTQIFSWGWLADYPDPENFLFLLYGPNSSAKCACDSVNNTNYDNPEFNALYEQIKVMENSPKRLKLIEKMVEISRIDAPWIFGYTPQEFYLNNQWVSNNKRHGVAGNLLKYTHIDPEIREKNQMKYNQPNIAPLIAGTGLFFALIIPAATAYRRRQKETI